MSDESDAAMDVDSPIRPAASPPLGRSPRLAVRRVTTSPPSPRRPARVLTSRKPGRPVHMIWRYFVKVSDGSSKPHAQCNYCDDAVRSGQPGANMQCHLKTCKFTPNDVKQQISEVYPDSLPGMAVANGQGPTQNYATSLTPTQQQQFELALASMFYLCAPSFALVESDAFRNPFKLLTPGIQFPSRQNLSGALLQSVHRETRKRAVEIIKDRKVVTVVTDSWTNVNHSSIINFVVVAPGMPSVFWSSLALGTASETAQYLKEQLGRVIDEIEQQTGVIVAGVLTDNTSNRSAAWALLEAARPIFGGGCSAHVINLLIQDITNLDFFKTIESKPVAVTTYVWDHHVMLSLFRTILSDTQCDHHRQLALPFSTRWYSLHACFSRVLENRTALKKLLTEPEFADLVKASASTKKATEKLSRVIQIVRDPTFWKNLEQVVAFLDPVIEALRELESDNCPASRVYSRFRWL